MRLHHLLLLGTIALAPGTALAVPAYTITDLGTLGGTSQHRQRHQRLRPGDGVSATADGATHAFLWTR